MNEIDFFKNTHTIVGTNRKTQDPKKPKAKKNKKLEADAEEDNQQDEDDEDDDEEELFTSQEEVFIFFFSYKDWRLQLEAQYITVVYRCPNSENSIEFVYTETTYRTHFANLQTFQHHITIFAHIFVVI